MFEGVLAGDPLAAVSTTQKLYPSITRPEGLARRTSIFRMPPEFPNFKLPRTKIHSVLSHDSHCPRKTCGALQTAWSQVPIISMISEH